MLVVGPLDFSLGPEHLVRQLAPSARLAEDPLDPLRRAVDLDGRCLVAKVHDDRVVCLVVEQVVGMAPVDHVGEPPPDPVRRERFVADAERIHVFERMPLPDDLSRLAIKLDNHVAHDFLPLARGVRVEFAGVVVVDLLPLRREYEDVAVGQLVDLVMESERVDRDALGRAFGTALRIPLVDCVAQPVDLDQAVVGGTEYDVPVPDLLEVADPRVDPVVPDDLADTVQGHQHSEIGVEPIHRLAAPDAPSARVE